MRIADLNSNNSKTPDLLTELFSQVIRNSTFIQEAHRILREEGVLLVATVNKDWSEFNPSPFSTRYFSVPKLNKLLHENRFNAEFYAAFSPLPEGFKERIIALIKRIAVALHLILRTMKGKEFLKRIFFGKPR